MAVDDDAGMLLFGKAQGSVVVCVEQMQNSPVCPLAVRVLKYLRIDSNRMFLTQMHRKLNLAVDDIILSDATAKESDHDDGRGFGSICSPRLRRGMRLQSSCQCGRWRKCRGNCRQRNGFGGLLSEGHSQAWQCAEEHKGKKYPEPGCRLLVAWIFGYEFGRSQIHKTSRLIALTPDLG